MNGKPTLKHQRLSKLVVKDVRGSSPIDRPGKNWRKGLKLSAFEGFNRVNGVKKYLCIGGEIGEGQFVSCSHLPKLYRIDPKECIFIPDGHVDQIETLLDGRLTGSPKLLGMDSRQYVVLRPDTTGRYQTPALSEAK